MRTGGRKKDWIIFFYSQPVRDKIMLQQFVSNLLFPVAHRCVQAKYLGSLKNILMYNTHNMIFMPCEWIPPQNRGLFLMSKGSKCAVSDFTLPDQKATFW